MSTAARARAPEERSVAVCIVVPQGCERAPALAAALARHHPDWDLGAIWCGDPQRRPSGGPLRWWDGPGGVTSPAAEHDLVRHPDAHVALARGARAARRLLASGHPHVVVAVAGAVAVLGPLDALVRGADGAITTVPLVLGDLPDDDLSPTRDDLELAGASSVDVLVAHAGAERALDWIEIQLAADLDTPAGAVLDRAVERFGGRRLADERIGASVWRWPRELAPALVDLPGFDPRRPWLLAPEMEGVARVPVVGDALVSGAIAAAADQLDGRRSPLTLPGGVVVDRIVRAAVADAPAHEAVPAPWTDPVAFRRWLAPRFWSALHAARPDLAAAFPAPGAGGADAAAFTLWQRRAWVDDTEVPPLLDVVAPSTTRRAPVAGSGSGAAARGRGDGSGVRRGRAVVSDAGCGDPYAPAEPLDVAPALRSDGVNVVGYLTRQTSLGDVARRLRSGFDAAGVPVAAIATHRTASPPLASPPEVERTVRFEDTVAVVTADQFPLLARDRPELFAATRRMVGYWFWELEHVPRAMRDALGLVDEVWVGSTFVQAAVSAVTRKAVRHVPIPVPRPEPSPRTRFDFPVLDGCEDAFVFLVVFDHLSVTERKNPVGAIEAFCRAFPVPQPGGPVLVVKSMNGRTRWREHQAVLAAAEGRADIRCVDTAMSRPDLMALVQAVDCLVSLHRSEGLGLHLAEAMWLGTPTIATRYSGNLDFMDDDTSLLVDASLVPVGDGGAGVYPPRARWAAPDLDAAAAAMASVAVDPDLVRRIAAAARVRMEEQPDLASVGRAAAQLLGIGRGSGGTVGPR